MTSIRSEGFLISQTNLRKVGTSYNLTNSSDGANRLLIQYGFGNRNTVYAVPLDIKLAMSFGRVPFLQEIIRRTGWGIDFEMLEREDESAQPMASERLGPPIFYAGLKVRGKFHREWAKAHTQVKELDSHTSKLPIAFVAIYFGTPEIVDWMFSEGPVKAIAEFIASHSYDKRSILLQKKDWKKEISKWFGTDFRKDGDNAFHAALFSRKADIIEKVYQIFIERGISPPALLESTQSKLAHNSLMIAARMGANFQNIYEKYNAYCEDPTFIDQHGYNILHILAKTKDLHNITFYMSHLASHQKEEMLVAKTFKAMYTPIAIAILSKRIDIVKCLLEGGKKQLHLRDGDGNLPIHLAVGRGFANIVQCLIDSDPKVLAIEDAAGLIPIDLARNRYLLDRTRTNPLVNVPENLASEFHHHNWIAHLCETQPGPSFLPPAIEPGTMDKPDFLATLDVVQKAMSKTRSLERKLVSLLEVSDVIRRATKDVSNSRDPVNNYSRVESPDYPSLGPPWSPLSSEQDVF
jgi:ankyrin repeat protein